MQTLFSNVTTRKEVGFLVPMFYSKDKKGLGRSN